MFNDDMTLRAAQDELRERIVDGEAVRCPACSQLAKVYSRTIHSTMARQLIKMHNHAGDLDGWMYLPEVLGADNTSDVAKLAYWGLIEQMEAERGDGSTRNGWWRVTEIGVLFVRRQHRVPKYARVYNGRLLGFDATSGFIGIEDALGGKFDYTELMSR